MAVAMVTVTVVLKDTENMLGVKEAVANALEPLGNIVSIQVSGAKREEQTRLVRRTK